MFLTFSTHTHSFFTLSLSQQSSTQSQSFDRDHLLGRNGIDANVSKENIKLKTKEVVIIHLCKKYKSSWFSNQCELLATLSVRRSHVMINCVGVQAWSMI